MYSTQTYLHTLIDVLVYSYNTQVRVRILNTHEGTISLLYFRVDSLLTDSQRRLFVRLPKEGLWDTVRGLVLFFTCTIRPLKIGCA